MRVLKLPLVMVCMVVLLAALSILAACSSGTTSSPTTSAPTTTQAQAPGKTIVLKLTSQNPPTFTASKAEQAWAEKIKEMSGGRLELQLYFSESLAKQTEVYRAVQTGVADIAYMTVGSDASVTPLSMITRRTFIGLPSVKASGVIFTDLYNKYPEIQAEWKNMKLLTSNGLPADQFFFAKKPVRLPADMEGMKVIARGNYPEIMTSIKAVPVGLGIADWYNSVEKGLVEGQVGIHFMAVNDFKLLDLYKYVTFFGDGGSDITNEIHVINQDSWNSLPADLQQILLDSCKWYEEFENEAIISGQNAGIAAVEAKNMEFVNLTAEDIEQWRAVVEPLDKQWIADNSAKGNAQAIFDECKALSKQYADLK